MHSEFEKRAGASPVMLIDSFRRMDLRLNIAYTLFPQILFFDLLDQIRLLHRFRDQVQNMNLRRVLRLHWYPRRGHGSDRRYPVLIQI